MHIVKINCQICVYRLQIIVYFVLIVCFLHVYMLYYVSFIKLLKIFSQNMIYAFLSLIWFCCNLRIFCVKFYIMKSQVCKLFLYFPCLKSSSETQELEIQGIWNPHTRMILEARFQNPHIMILESI